MLMLKIPSQHALLPLLYFNWTFELLRIDWHLLTGFHCRHHLNYAAVLQNILYLQMLKNFYGYSPLDLLHRRLGWIVFLIILGLCLSLLILCFPLFAVLESNHAFRKHPQQLQTQLQSWGWVPRLVQAQQPYGQDPDQGDLWQAEGQADTQWLHPGWCHPDWCWQPRWDTYI